jgi:hypothetical protein
VRAKAELGALHEIAASDATRYRVTDLEERRQHTAAILALAAAYQLPSSSAPNAPRSQSPSDHSDVWRPASEAVEVFAERDLVAERDKQADQFYEGYMKAHEAKDEIQKIQNKFGDWRSLDPNTSEGFHLALNQRRLTLYEMQTNQATDGLKRAWDALRLDIASKLTRGALIAKGFRSPHVAGRIEIEILPAEWRIMDLNNVTSDAIKKGSNEILYSGVALCKAD